MTCLFVRQGAAAQHHYLLCCINCSVTSCSHLLALLATCLCRWHDQADHAPSKMASLLATDTASARGAVADVLGLALQTLGALGFGYAIAIYCDWRVALLVTGLLPLLVSGGVIQTRCVWRLSGPHMHFSTHG